MALAVAPPRPEQGTATMRRRAGDASERSAAGLATRVAAWLAGEGPGGAGFAPRGPHALVAPPDRTEVAQLCRGRHACEVLQWLVENVREEEYVAIVKANAQLELLEHGDGVEGSVAVDSGAQPDRPQSDASATLGAEETSGGVSAAAAAEIVQLEAEVARLLEEIDAAAASADRDGLAVDAALEAIDRVNEEAEQLSEMERRLEVLSKRLDSNSQGRDGATDHALALAAQSARLLESLDANALLRSAEPACQASTDDAALVRALEQEVGEAVRDALEVGAANKALEQEIGRLAKQLRVTQASLAQDGVEAATREAAEVVQDFEAAVAAQRCAGSDTQAALAEQAQLVAQLCAAKERISQQCGANRKLADWLATEAAKVQQGAATAAIKDSFAMRELPAVEFQEVGGTPATSAGDDWVLGIERYEHALSLAAMKGAHHSIDSRWAAVAAEVNENMVRPLLASEAALAPGQTRSALRRADETKRRLASLLADAQHAAEDQVKAAMEAVATAAKAVQESYEQPGQHACDGLLTVNGISLEQHLIYTADER